MNKLNIVSLKTLRHIMYALAITLVIGTTKSFAFYDENGHQSQTSSIQVNLNNILSHFKAYRIGVSIQSLSSGRVLYQYNANHGFVPASTLKLFTGIAALDYLGPHFQFKTRFLTNPGAQIRNGVLAGNLYIKFSGDPYLTLDDLKDMLTTLNEQHITKV